MLRILNVAYPFAPVGIDASGGAEQVLSAIDRALHSAGHHSIVLACEGSSTSGELVSIPVDRTSPIDETRRKFVHAHMRRCLDSLLRTRRFDVIHFHGIDFHAYLPSGGPPALITLHLPPSWYPADALFPSRADTWMNCVSSDQQSSLPVHEPRTSIRLMPPIENGVDVDALGSSHHARRGFALVLGRICPEKGQHIAIAAARAARIPLLIAGALFPYKDHLAYFEKEIRPQLGRCARYLGPVGFARKRRLLSAARCLLIPSLAPETSSLVAMEALACGTPVIAFRAGAVPGIVEHNRTGFVVDHADQMADAMRYVPEISPALCRQVARERYSSKRMTDTYINAYTVLARARSS